MLFGPKRGPRGGEQTTDILAARQALRPSSLIALGSGQSRVGHRSGQDGPVACRPLHDQSTSLSQCPVMAVPRHRHTHGAEKRGLLG